MEPTFIEIFYWAILPALAQAVAVFLGVFLSILLVSKSVLSRNRKESAEGKDASDILRERYARGDISRGEFERMREDMKPETSEPSGSVRSGGHKERV